MAMPHEWWEKRRLNYNFGLIASGIIAFVAYAIVGSILFRHDESFEITIFTIFFQGTGYLFMMVIANLFYFLGACIDERYNKENTEEFRLRLYNTGFWFSFALPFSIPFLLIVSYFLST